MTKWLWILGLVVGAATAFLLYDYVTKLERAQTALSFLRISPNSQVSQGASVQSADLQSVQLPDTFTEMSSLAIPDTPENRRWLLAQPASRDIAPGALLQFDFFEDRPERRFSASIAEGMRAMTIAVDPTAAVAYFVEPGSRIDLVGTLEATRQTNIPIDIPRGVRPQVGADTANIPDFQVSTVTKTILQNVRVLAVGQATTRGSYLGGAKEGYGTITIEVSPSQAEKLVFARGQLLDQVTVLLRNPSDDETQNLPDVSWEELD